MVIGVLQKIGKNAFSYLKSKLDKTIFHSTSYILCDLSDLRRIELYNNNITKIEVDAFNFFEPSDNDLFINLEGNNVLGGESFEDPVFATDNRKVSIRLGHNKGLKYLKEETFLTIFIRQKSSK